VRALVFRFGWAHEAAERLTASTASHWAEEAMIFIERNRPS
jgi:hypothetical protein